MRVLLLNRGLSRGAVAALLVATAVSPLVAQGGGAGGRVGGRRDSLFVRLFDASSVRARLESLTVLSRALDEATPESPRALELRAQVEAMMTALRAATVATGGFAGGGRGIARIVVGGAEGMTHFEATRMFSGWIGVTAASSVPYADMVRNDNYFIRYLSYPSIVSVEPNSPAQRAGIEVGDLLVAYDGSDVVAHESNLTQLFVPDRKLSVTVRRDGETRDYAMTVEKAPQRIIVQRFDRGEPGMPVPLTGNRVEPSRGGVVASGTLRATRPGVPAGAQTFDVVTGPLMTARGVYQMNGVFGASMIALKPELATVLKLEAGVLVDQVPEDTPAYRAGLKVGDVIVNVAGMAVSNVRDVQVIVQTRSDNKTIALQIVRDRKAKQLTVKW